MKLVLLAATMIPVEDSSSEDFDPYEEDIALGGEWRVAKDFCLQATHNLQEAADQVCRAQQIRIEALRNFEKAETNMLNAKKIFHEADAKLKLVEEKLKAKVKAEGEAKLKRRKKGDEDNEGNEDFNHCMKAMKDLE